MSTILAFISLAFLALSTFFSEGSSRYFEVSSNVGTAPFTITLNASDLDKAKQAERFIWDFGNGESLTTANPIVQYTYQSAGVFTLKLRYLKKAKDNLSKAKDGGSVKIVVSPKPNILPIPQLSCVSNEVNKLECDSAGSTDSDGTIASYKFDWGDSTTNDFTSAGVVSHQYQSAGEKTIRLTVTDNKNGTAFIEKSVVLKANTAPVANFSCSKAGIQKIHCESTSTDNEETLSNFAWTLDDGATYNTASFDHTFNRPQDVAIVSHNISLKVTDSLGLESLLAKDVEVDLEAIREAPRGYFKAYIDRTTVDLRAFIIKTQFNIKSATYQIYNSQNTLIHTLPISGFYQNQSTKINLENYGNYRVTLTIVDYRDQQIVVTRQVPLVEDTSTLSPFVSFRAIQSNIRTLYLNLNQSFDYDENYTIREFVVNLGNGQTRTPTTDTFLTYTYPEAGTYTISVTARTNHGTERTFSQPITITDSEVAPVMPDPTFAYRIYSFAQNVSFYNEKSGTPNGEIISYLWDFGDGTTATGETQAHFYMPGEYLVKLTVVDTAGYSSTQTQKITILAEGDDIVANIDCNQRQPYLDITQLCKVNALDKFNEINRIRVVWGDGAVFTLTTPFDPRQGVYYPQKAYTAEGTYSVRLIVNTARGAFKTHDISHTVTARRPVANIQCVVNNLMLYCNAFGSFDPKGTSLSYTFDFGNGYTESSPSGVVNYAYSEAGLYDVSLKVTDATGLSSIATTKVQAVVPPNQLPVANLNCVTSRPLTLGCNAGPSYDPDGIIVSARYEFDDGTVETYDKDFFFDHRFATAGLHSVKLTVTDNSGGQSTVEKTYNVLANNPPTVAFECRSDKVFEIICDSGSFDTDGFVVQSNWFINGVMTTFTGDYIQRMFEDATPVKVKLQLVDNDGAISELEKDVVVRDNLPPVAGAVCQSSGPLNLNCYSTSYDPENSGNLKVEWIIGNQVISNDEYFNTQLSISGMAYVILKVTDFYGAVTVLDTPVLIQENLAPIAIADCNLTEDASLFCKSNSYDPEGQGLSQIKWTLSNGTIFLGESFTYKLNGESEIIFDLEVRDTLGATSVLNKVVPVNVTPPPVITPVAESCPVSEKLKDKICSEEYFRPANSDELADYLHNGIYLDNKLLNLEIDSRIDLASYSQLSIATPCRLKIISNANVVVSNQHLCLGGKSIEINNSTINVANNGDLKIISSEIINISNSSISAPEKTLLKTNSFDPYQGGVFLKQSEIKSSIAIKISTPSNLEISDDTVITSGGLNFQAGRCLVREMEADGTCNEKAFENISINSLIDESRNIIFSLNSQSEKQSIEQLWRLNESVVGISKNNEITTESILPGIHTVDVVVMDENNRFEKVKKNLNVPIRTIYKYKSNVLYFNLISEHLTSIKAYIDDEEILLSTFEDDPKHLGFIYDGTKIGTHTLRIPDLNYSESVELKSDAVIMDPEQFLTNYYDEIIVKLDSETEPISPELELIRENIKNLINTAKGTFSEISFDDKLLVAEIIRANQKPSIETSSFVPTNKKLESFSLLDLFINTAEAQDAIRTEDDGLIWTIAKTGVLIYSIKLYVHNSKVVHTYLLNKLQQPGLTNPQRIFLAASNGALYVIDILAFFKAVDFAIKIYENLRLPNWIISVGNGIIKASVKAELIFRTLFLPVGASNSTSFNLIKTVTDSLEQINAQINNSNSLITSFNSIFTSLGLSSLTIKKIPNIKFTNTQKIGELSGKYIQSVDIVSSEKGNISVVHDKAERLGITITSKYSQKVKLRFHYFNSFLDADIKFDKEVDVIAPPIAVINYTSNKLVVDFDSTDPQNPSVTGLTYLWNFGDGKTETTASKTLSHSYSQSGTYTVLLTVTDAYGVSDTEEIVVDVTGDLASVTICNAGLLDNVMNFQIDGIAPFSLSHIFPASGNNEDPHTCECKTVQMPINQSTNIYVDGTDQYTGQSISLTPYSGQIYLSGNYSQPFSISADIINNQLVLGVYRGIYAVDRCGIIINK